VLHDDVGMTLRAFLKDKARSLYSVRQLKWAIDHDLVEINDRVERHSTVRVSTGDLVSCDLAGISGRDNIAKDVENERILYEDDSILVYDKPPHIPTMKKGLLEILQGYCSELRPVHRLDRDTSGALIFAKSEDALKALVEQFRQKSVKKVYWAIVDGILKKKNGVVKNYIGKRKDKVWGIVDKKNGRLAVTAWQCLKSDKNITLIECCPETGRTHQVRIHLKSIGHPVLGDYTYCRDFSSHHHPKRHLLHSRSVEFAHPSTGRHLIVTAPLPEDFMITV